MDAIRDDLVSQLGHMLRRNQRTLALHYRSSINNHANLSENMEKHRHDLQEELEPALQNDKKQETTMEDAATIGQESTTRIRTTEQSIELTIRQQQFGSIQQTVHSASNNETPQGENSSVESHVDAIRSHAGEERESQHDESVTVSRPVSIADVIQAKQSLLLFRSYLPQLVATVLKSPPSFDLRIADPIQQLRTLLLARCVQDPSMGIELCWLLEAEVGRTWKTLFEHREKQSGRRLIIVLPADKAVVLAQIGMEKRDAFDLLQDTEQATAYGYTESLLLDQQPNSDSDLADYDGHVDYFASDLTKLPSSLSLRRCSHFGDAMQFIDRLSKISSDLRMVPCQHRYAVLHESLHELNRRIRRRMVTRGDVSLDIEDNRSAHDWPHIENMSIDMIQHTVHLPLLPQTGTWSNGETTSNAQNGAAAEKKIPNTEAVNVRAEKKIPNTEVVRVLNLVVSESKLLSSRERCPFLVHLEVADSGFEGSDARLYSAGVSGLGSTVSEALGLQKREASSERPRLPFLQGNSKGAAYGIPNELLNLPTALEQDQSFFLTASVKSDVVTTPEEIQNSVEESMKFPRGGYQREGQYYDHHDVLTNDYAVDPFDLVRQHQYEQLHQQLQSQRNMVLPPSALPLSSKVSTGANLLDLVFGQTWQEKCKAIKDSSPYGYIQGWRLASFILKAGEDIRREAFVMQIISKLQEWFVNEIPQEHRPFMRPYTIMCVGGDAGLLECLSDAKSVDEVKKRTDGYTTLRDYFERAYGPPRATPQFAQNGPNNHDTAVSPHAAFGLHKVAMKTQGIVSFETAQDNFLRSLVGYSLVCYILQIKDRHNANILLDRVGHIMHIDFGFVLGDTPKMGKVPIFSERAPFKLSGDFWDVLGGWNVQGGGLGVKFCKMFELAFECASSHAEEIATLTEAVILSLDSNPRSARASANGVRARLRMRGRPGSREQKMFVMDLVNAALTSWGTSTYDWLQRNMNGYQ